MTWHLARPTSRRSWCGRSSSSFPERPEVIPNAEVAAHHWVELDALLHPDSYRPVTIQLGAAARDFPAYHVSPIPVWGMTERILAPLVALLRAT